jgi:hypothetical protein
VIADGDDLFGPFPDERSAGTGGSGVEDGTDVENDVVEFGSVLDAGLALLAGLGFWVGKKRKRETEG